MRAFKFIQHAILPAAALLLALGPPAAGGEPARQGADHPRTVLPVYYSDIYRKRTGVLQQIDFSRNELLVSATRYRFAPNTKVHSLATENSSIYRLSPGMVLALELKPDRRGGKRIERIWILPDSMAGVGY